MGHSGWIRLSESAHPTLGERRRADGACQGPFSSRELAAGEWGSGPRGSGFTCVHGSGAPDGFAARVSLSGGAGEGWLRGWPSDRTLTESQDIVTPGPRSGQTGRKRKAAKQLRETAPVVLLLPQEQKSCSVCMHVCSHCAVCSFVRSSFHFHSGNTLLTVSGAVDALMSRDAHRLLRADSQRIWDSAPG